MITVNGLTHGPVEVSRAGFPVQQRKCRLEEKTAVCEMCPPPELIREEMTTGIARGQRRPANP
jgi:hypothetical protein